MMEIEANHNQWSVNDLKPLSTYEIRMMAVNVFGKSEPSQVLRITTEEDGKHTDNGNKGRLPVDSSEKSHDAVLISSLAYSFMIIHETRELFLMKNAAFRMSQRV